MRITLLLFFLLISSAIFSAVPDTSSAKAAKLSSLTVSGYLEDSETGAGIEISVLGPGGDYENYVIAEKGKGKELKKQVGQLVSLTGIVQDNKKKLKIFFVEKYEILKPLPADSGLTE